MIAILFLQGTPMLNIILPILAKDCFLLLLVLTANFPQTSLANRIVPPLNCPSKKSLCMLAIKS